MKRTLLLTVHRDAPAESIARLEVDLMAMPDHISSICSWTRSRTAGGVWAHAWGQDYRDVDGLVGEYLRHPFHWACADRWCECEVPTSIVLLAVAHVYRWADGPVLL